MNKNKNTNTNTNTNLKNDYSANSIGGRLSQLLVEKIINTNTNQKQDGRETNAKNSTKTSNEQKSV